MSIIQKPIFNTTLNATVKLSFTTESLNNNEGYKRIIAYISNQFNCQYITERGHTIHNEAVYTTQTMLIPSAYIKSGEDFKTLKNLVKYTCQRNEAICFLEFGSTQNIYDYRNINK